MGAIPIELGMSPCSTEPSSVSELRSGLGSLIGSCTDTKYPEPTQAADCNRRVHY